MTATLPTGEPLTGRQVRLDLMTEDDIDELHPLVSDPAVYASGYAMHRRPTSPQDSRELARTRFLVGQGCLDGRGGGRAVYAVRLVDDSELGQAGTLVGMSALLEAQLYHESIHLGSTLYGRRWWGTAVNAEAKLLLLTHCFEDCGYGRVKIQTDALNVRSQAAIRKLGAIQEGVLRRDLKREDGTFRDTVVFSVISDEWPDVRDGLRRRLRRAAPAEPQSPQDPTVAVDVSATGQIFTPGEQATGMRLTSENENTAVDPGHRSAQMETRSPAHVSQGAGET